MCGILDNLGSIAKVGSSIAAMVPGPWQIPAAMTAGVLGLQSGNPTSALGLLGPVGNVAGLGAFGGSGGLADSWSQASDAASGGSGLENIFRGMSLPGVGGGSAINASDVFNQFPETMSGFSGPTVGGGLGSTVSGLTASTPGYGEETGGTPIMSPSSPISSPITPPASVATPASTAAPQSFLEQLFTAPKGQGFDKSPFGLLAGGLLKGFGAYQDYQGAKNAQRAYQNQLNTLNQLYSPNSPYAQQMKNVLARRDAATGRNSQYGPRAEALAADLTKNQAALMGSPAYTNLVGASNQTAVPWASALASGNSIIKGLSGLF